MAPSSRGRSRGGPRQRPPSRAARPQSGTGRPPPLRSAFDGIYADARGFSRSLDPLEVETFASGVVSTWRQDVPMPNADEAAKALAELLAKHLAAKRSPDALALMLGIEAVAPGPLAAVFAAPIARLRVGGLTDPVWVASIRLIRFVEGWRSTDEYGDQDMVMAVFEHAGRPPHGIGLRVDHNMGGMAKEVLVTDEPDGLRSDWLARSGLRIVSLNAQEVADRFAGALQAYDETFMPETSKETRYLLPLVRARLRLLPAGVAAERVEIPTAERESLLADFEASPEATAGDEAGAGRKPGPRAGATAGPTAGPKAAAGDVGLLASYFVDYGCDYGTGDPLRWSPIAVELVLLDWFPRKVMLEGLATAAVPDALRRFVRYAGRRKGLSEASIADTVAAVDEFEAEYLLAMADTAGYGPAKAIVSAMRSESVDPTDPAAVAGWMEAFNARPASERDRLLGRLPDLDGLAGGLPNLDQLATADPTVAARREFACPPIDGRVRGIDAADLDPADPDERGMLIEAEHPGMFAAIKAGRKIKVGPSGIAANPKLHVAMHEIVANQLWDGEPPETWEAAQRLLAQGYSRHEVLHMLAEVASGLVWKALHEQPAGPGVDLNVEMRAAMAALGRGGSAGVEEAGYGTNAPIPIDSRRRRLH